MPQYALGGALLPSIRQAQSSCATSYHCRRWAPSTRGATFLKAEHQLEMLNACLNMHSVERQYLVLDKPSHHVQRHATAVGGHYRRGQRNKGHNFEENAHQQ